MKILIVKLSAIGDVIHTLPALNAVRSHFPHAHIAWVVEQEAADLLQGHPALDRLLVSERKRWIRARRAEDVRRSLKEALRFFRQLRDTRYDLIIDFQALLKSAVLIALARGRRKVGFDRGLEHMEHSYLFLNERIAPVSMEVHALERGLRLLEAIGIPAQRVEYRIPVAGRTEEEISGLLGHRGIRGDRPLVAVNPVAQWATKLWPEDRFAQLAGRLRKRFGADVVFTGGPGDRDAVVRIQARMIEKAANLAGETSLRQLAALYKRAALVISTDTGPMHLAAAMGTPVVALFGPTAPWRTGPFGQGHRVVRIGAECSPCFKRRCPDPLCMTGISVDRVMEEVDSLAVL